MYMCSVTVRLLQSRKFIYTSSFNLTNVIKSCFSSCIRMKEKPSVLVKHQGFDLFTVTSAEGQCHRLMTRAKISFIRTKIIIPDVTVTLLIFIRSLKKNMKCLSSILSSCAARRLSARNITSGLDI